MIEPESMTESELCARYAQAYVSVNIGKTVNVTHINGWFRVTAKSRIFDWNRSRLISAIKDLESRPKKTVDIL